VFARKKKGFEKDDNILLLCARVLVFGFKNTERLRSTQRSAPNISIIKICCTVLHGTVPVEINSEIRGGL
jgi:hypothetical protein